MSEETLSLETHTRQRARWCVVALFATAASQAVLAVVWRAEGLGLFCGCASLLAFAVGVFWLVRLSRAAPETAQLDDAADDAAHRS